MEALAAVLQERRAALHGDLLERFEAVGNEAGTDHVDRAHALVGHRLETGLGIGLQPFGPAEARLEGHQVAVLGQAKRFGQQPARSSGIRSGRVALVERESRHAMKAHHQLFGLAVARPVFAYRCGQRRDISGVAREVPHVADFWQVAPLEHAARDLVHDARGRARSVLRVGGYDEDPGAACGAHALQRGRNRRFAVAHRELDHQCIVPLAAEIALEELCLALGMELERRAFVGPHRRVLLRRLSRPGGEDDPVEDQPPDGARDLHHPGV